jgi:hypothetical protein
MTRSFLGGIVAGFILFAMGYLFWQTPLSGLAYKNLPDQQGSVVQQALGQNLSQTGNGTYRIPNPNSDEGSRLYTRGPVATVDYHVGGFSPTSAAVILPELIVAIGAGMLIAFGLGGVASGKAFGELARLVVFVSLGVCIWAFGSIALANHFGWSFWAYAFFAEAASLVVAGLVVARWFVPHGHVTAAAAAPEPVHEP